jgi:hypothetical protein
MPSYTLEQSILEREFERFCLLSAIYQAFASFIEDAEAIHYQKGSYIFEQKASSLLGGTNKPLPVESITWVVIEGGKLGWKCTDYTLTADMLTITLSREGGYTETITFDISRVRRSQRLSIEMYLRTMLGLRRLNQKAQHQPSHQPTQVAV